MQAETVSIVNDLKKVSISQVAFEAITNSIHAEANHIHVAINSLNDDFDDTESQLVSEVIITDNGHGFKEKDLKSFQTYRSLHKKKLGAKGIGRFLYLKLFERVNVISLNKEIKFTLEDDVVIENTNEYHKNTILSLTVAKESYQVNKEDFCKDVELHFLPLFKLLNAKADRNPVVIDIVFGGSIFRTIKSNEIPSFQVDSFEINGSIFEVSYLLNHTDYKSGDGAYCADGRVVGFNSQMDANKKFKAFKGVDFFYLLSSEYFNKNLNDERDSLLINAKRKSQKNFLNSISWEDIHAALGEKVREICLENGIDISEKSEEYLNKAIDSAPFLSSYFRGNELMLPEDDLLKQAQKVFNEDKMKLRGNNSRLSESERGIILNRVVQAELAEYVFDRQKTIERLKVLETEKALEKAIHDLFMKRFTKDEECDFRTNNLWLFDDRFMSYDKIFSDKQIKEIFPELHENLDKPDVLSISSNTFDKSGITDIVIIELKRPGANNDVAIAEKELLKYSRYARGSDFKNIRIWTYAFVSFTEETDLELADKDYNQIPVQNGWPIKYKYHKSVNTIINFIDYKSLAHDAETRNNTFLNILKAKHHRVEEG